MADITCTAYCNSNARNETPIVEFLHHLEFPNRFLPTFQLVFVCPFGLAIPSPFRSFCQSANWLLVHVPFRFNKIFDAFGMWSGCVHSFSELNVLTLLLQFDTISHRMTGQNDWRTGCSCYILPLLFHCNQCCLPPPPSSSSSSLLLSFSLSHFIFVIRPPHGSLSLYLFSASYFLILSWINVKITRQKYTGIHQTSQWYK